MFPFSPSRHRLDIIGELSCHRVVGAFVEARKIARIFKPPHMLPHHSVDDNSLIQILETSRVIIGVTTRHQDGNASRTPQ